MMRYSKTVYWGWGTNCCSWLDQINFPLHSSKYTRLSKVPVRACVHAQCQSDSFIKNGSKLYFPWLNLQFYRELWSLSVCVGCQQQRRENFSTSSWVCVSDINEFVLPLYGSNVTDEHIKVFNYLSAIITFDHSSQSDFGHDCFTEEN